MILLVIYFNFPMKQEYQIKLLLNFNNLYKLIEILLWIGLRNWQMDFNFDQCHVHSGNNNPRADYTMDNVHLTKLGR